MTAARVGAALALALVLILTAACGQETPVEVAGDTRLLTPDTYATYKAQILPTDEERAWEQIEWYPSYAEGLREASRRERPMLLWVMNGHPLGCT